MLKKIHFGQAFSAIFKPSLWMQIVKYLPSTMSHFYPYTWTIKLFFFSFCKIIYFTLRDIFKHLWFLINITTVGSNSLVSKIRIHKQLQWIVWPFSILDFMVQAFFSKRYWFRSQRHWHWCISYEYAEWCMYQLNWTFKHNWCLFVI